MNAGQQLRDWIKEKGYRRGFVAEMLGISCITLNKLLVGSGRPSLDLAVRISRLTGIEPGEWVQ